MPSSGQKQGGAITQSGNTPYVRDIFDRVTKIKNELVSEFSDPNLVIKVQINAENHVHTWIEYKGKTSLGFYAELPQFGNRLSKGGMKEWVKDSIQQLTLVEVVESLGVSRNIGTDRNSTISMKLRKLYTGEVEVTLYDSFTKKTEKFIANHKKDTTSDVIGKLDGTLSKFLAV